MIYRENDDMTPLSLSQGIINYKSEAWTQNQSILFALYYLSANIGLIEPFSPRGKTHLFHNDSVIPTLSPNDPAFAEWAKEHIEE